MKHKAIIVYGLGKVFKENLEYLKETFTIVGYSDQDVNKKEGLDNPEEFIAVEDILDYSFHKIVICGGGISAKRQLIYRFMDEILEEDIVLLEDLKARRISKSQFERDVITYQQTSAGNSFTFKKEQLYPVVKDIAEGADRLDSHYFMQDICVARKVMENNPSEHYDVGSRVDGFISHLLVFRKNITLIDVRPLQEKIAGIQFVMADATNMEGIEDRSIESLSCLHALEHFGLGRYGDSVNAEACFIALKSFQRVLKRKGKLYLSVPCGSSDELFFNAHRMFHPLTIINALTECDLLEFEIVKDFQIESICTDDISKLNSLGEYYCGIFTFEKR